MDTKRKEEPTFIDRKSLSGVEVPEDCTGPTPEEVAYKPQMEVRYLPRYTFPVVILILLTAFIVGGGQESGMRSGTENVPAIGAFGAAAVAAQHDLGRMADLKALRDWLERELRTAAAEMVVFGAGAPRVKAM